MWQKGLTWGYSELENPDRPHLSTMLPLSPHSCSPTTHSWQGILYPSVSPSLALLHQGFPNPTTTLCRVEVQHEPAQIHKLCQDTNYFAIFKQP